MNADQAMSEYAQGNAKAFEIVYDTVAPRLEGYLSRHVRERARVEDIIQQTFLQMHNARGSFILGAEVLPWAFAIAKTTMIDSMRKMRHEGPQHAGDDGEAHGALLVSGLASGEEMVQAKETTACLLAAFRKLSEPQRAAWELVKTEGMSHAQAASILGTTVMGVRLRAHRVYVALRSALAARDADGPRAEPVAMLATAKDADEPIS